jgi:hypothetical protein
MWCLSPVFFFSFSHFLANFCVWWWWSPLDEKLWNSTSLGTTLFFLAQLFDLSVTPLSNTNLWYIHTTEYYLRLQTYLIFSIETMSIPRPPPPPCGLSRQEVMALRPDVPLKDGKCQNLRIDGTVCDCPIVAHPSETAVGKKQFPYSLRLRYLISCLSLFVYSSAIFLHNMRNILMCSVLNCRT